MKKITIGVLGGGRIGQVHMSAMQLDPRIEIKTVADAFMNEKMDKALRVYGVQHTTKNPDDIFSDKEINAVFICSPTDTHSEFSISAIRNNKHVFCEKPIDMDIQRIKKVQAELNKKSNLVYQVGFNRRFDHNFMAVRKAIESKKIGTPQMLKVISRDPGPPPIEYIKTSGGLFLDMMIHDFDMVRFQSGSEVEEVYALGANLVDKNIGKIGGDIDSAFVSLKFKNGMIGMIENCRKASYGYDQRVEVLGDKGAVQVGNDTQSTLVLSNNSGVTSEKPLYFFLERYKDAYILEQKFFYDSILKKKASVCGLQDGLESVRIAHAAIKSMKEHRPVALKEIQ